MAENAYFPIVKSDSGQGDRTQTPNPIGRESYTLERGLLKNQDTGSVVTVSPSGTSGKSTIRKSYQSRPFESISESDPLTLQLTFEKDKREQTKSRERVLEESREYSRLLREKTGNPFDFAAGILKKSFDPSLLDALLDEYFGAAENDSLEIDE